MRYHGRIRIQETKGADLAVDVEVSDTHVRLVSGEEALGSWCLADVVAARVVANQFEIDLDGEVITFLADDQVNFAYGAVQAMAEGWARFHSMNVLSRKRAVASARRQNEPSRLEEAHRAFGKAKEELDATLSPTVDAEGEAVTEAGPVEVTGADAEPAGTGGFWAKVEAATGAARTAPGSAEVTGPTDEQEATTSGDEESLSMPRVEPVPAAEQMSDEATGGAAAPETPAMVGRIKRLDALPKRSRVRPQQDRSSPAAKTGEHARPPQETSPAEPPAARLPERPHPRPRPRLRDVEAGEKHARPVDPETAGPAAAPPETPEAEAVTPTRSEAELPSVPEPGPVSATRATPAEAESKRGVSRTPSQPVSPPERKPENIESREPGRMPEPGPAVEHEPIPQPAPEPEPTPEPVAEIGPALEPEPVPGLETGSESKPERKPEPEVTPEPGAEPDPEDGEESLGRNGARRRQAALVGAFGDGHHPAETSGLRASMRSVFSRKKGVHEHSYVESTTMVGITRRVCLECGHVSIGVEE